MEFEQASPVGFPLGIQKQQQVESAVQVASRVKVEVDVWIKVLAIKVLMGPAAHIVWIIEKPRNAGNLAQQAEKLRLLQHTIEPAIVRTELPQVFMHGLAAHFPELVTGLLGIKTRKLLD